MKLMVLFEVEVKGVKLGGVEEGVFGLGLSI